MDLPSSVFIVNVVEIENFGLHLHQQMDTRTSIFKDSQVGAWKIFRPLSPSELFSLLTHKVSPGCCGADFWPSFKPPFSYNFAKFSVVTSVGILLKLSRVQTSKDFFQPEVTISRAAAHSIEFLLHIPFFAAYVIIRKLLLLFTSRDN